jgi:hypothetical protein
MARCFHLLAPIIGMSIDKSPRRQVKEACELRRVKQVIVKDGVKNTSLHVRPQGTERRCAGSRRFVIGAEHVQRPVSPTMQRGLPKRAHHLALETVRRITVEVVMLALPAIHGVSSIWHTCANRTNDLSSVLRGADVNCVVHQCSPRSRTVDMLFWQPAKSGI